MYRNFKVEGRSRLRAAISRVIAAGTPLLPFIHKRCRRGWPDLSEAGHYVISGDVNSGKSTRLWEEYEILSKQGVKVSGWVTIASSKPSYDIIILVESAVRGRLEFIREKPFERSFKWRNLWFNEDVFRMIHEIDLGRPDIFFIDEVGPLELEDKLGFYKDLPRIYSQYDRTVTVVRTSSLEKFFSLFPEHSKNFYQTGQLGV